MMSLLMHRVDHTLVTYAIIPSFGLNITQPAQLYLAGLVMVIVSSKCEHLCVILNRKQYMGRTDMVIYRENLCVNDIVAYTSISSFN